MSIIYIIFCIRLQISFTKPLMRHCKRKAGFYDIEGFRNDLKSLNGNICSATHLTSFVNGDMNIMNNDWSRQNNDTAFYNRAFLLHENCYIVTISLSYVLHTYLIFLIGSNSMYVGTPRHTTMPT